MNTIGMTACMPTATAHRPSPVTRPPTKLITPIIRMVVASQGSASWIATVESIASAKPKPSVRAFSRQGAGRSEMLADIAPRVAGCPAAKPKDRRSDECDRDHAQTDTRAVDNVLADKKPRETLGARPARHEGPAEF